MYEFKAEELYEKLNLIDTNKNLLPYPYSTAFQTGLENVGDGSFLTTGEATVEDDILLNTESLLAGTYTASLKVTDIIDALGTVENPGFDLKVQIDGKDQDRTFTISEEKPVKIYLTVPNNCTTKNLLIKPQIEKGTEATDWVPYMDKIGIYVDERFNGTSAKIKVLMERLATIESLLASGTVLLVEKETDSGSNS